MAQSFWGKSPFLRMPITIPDAEIACPLYNDRHANGLKPMAWQRADKGNAQRKARPQSGHPRNGPLAFHDAQLLQASSCPLNLARLCQCVLNTSPPSGARDTTNDKDPQ